jgi:hypothetical protein
MPSHLTRRPSGTIPLHNSALPRRSELAGSEVGPEEANKRGGVRLDSRVAESQWWLGWRDVRRWLAARQWQHGRHDSGCGETP